MCKDVQKSRIVDTSPEHSKWLEVEAEKVFEAMRAHGDEKSGGIWAIDN